MFLTLNPPPGCPLTPCGTAPPHAINRQARRFTKMTDSKKSAAAIPDDGAGTESPLAHAYKIGDPGTFARNMVQVGVQSQQLLTDFLRRQSAKSGNEPLDPLNITSAFTELLRSM